MEQVSKELADILACPKCKAAVKQNGNFLQCSDSRCGLMYPIRDGIPVMLIDEAARPGEVKGAEGTCS